MVKVFISQPMTDRDLEEIQLERDSIISDLKSKGYEISDTVVIGNVPDCQYQSVHYLSDAFRYIAHSDAIYFAGGWKESKGCTVEHFTAMLYNIPIIHE